MGGKASSKIPNRESLSPLPPQVLVARTSDKFRSTRHQSLSNRANFNREAISRYWTNRG